MTDCPRFAAELVNLRVAVIFAAGGPPSALAAKEATSTIPPSSFFAWVSFFPSLSRPGGNLTGMSLLNSELVGKSIQLLKEAVPAAAVMVRFLVATVLRPEPLNFLRERSARGGAHAGGPDFCAQRQH